MRGGTGGMRGERGGTREERGGTRGGRGGTREGRGEVLRLGGRRRGVVAERGRGKKSLSEVGIGAL